MAKQYKTISYKKPTSTYSAKEYDEKKGPYKSQIKGAQTLLNKHLNAKPSDYQSLYQNQINNTISSIENRKPFVYDLNADALYQNLKNQYVGLGQQAMADTIGQASALTGGYGNSYAVTAGNQAYQSYLNNLNDIVPELYDKAYGRYQDEGVDLYNKLNMYQTQDSLDYGKYQDAYLNWQNDRDYYAGELSNLRGLNQDAWSQNETNRFNANNLAWENYFNAQNFNFDTYQQSVAENQWNKEFKEDQRQFDTTHAENQRQFDTTHAENQRQFDMTHAENQRQFDMNYAEEQRQYDTTHAENQRQYNTNRADQNYQFQAELSQKNSANSTSTKGKKVDLTKYSNSKNVTSFKGRVLTRSEFSARGGYNGHKSYDDYIENAIDNDKSLSNEEKLYLMDYYGI